MKHASPDAVRVVGAAILEEGLCLAVQRSATMSTPLLWEFPGGKIEDGESPREALRREILEELGLSIEVGAAVAVGTSVEEGRTIRLEVFRARRLGGELALKEHRAFRWLGPEELTEVEWAAADLPAVAALQRRGLG
jgi:8-oxo-dGTP diphosphatase